MYSITICWLCKENKKASLTLNDLDNDHVKLSYKLKFVLPEIVDEENLTHLICVTCYNELNQAYKFKKKCLDVHEYLPNNDDVKLFDIANIKQEKLDSIKTFDDNVNCEDSGSSCASTVILQLNNELESFVKTENSTDQNNVRNKKIHLGKDILGMQLNPDDPNEYTLNHPTKSVLKFVYIYDDHNKIYICKNCDTHFLGNRALARHLYFHIDDKPYKCNQCSYKTFRYPQIRLHKMKEHNEMHETTCNTCKIKFPVIEYERHKLTHRNKRYPCLLCNFIAKTKFFLERHHKKLHKIDINNVDNETSTSKLCI